MSNTAPVLAFSVVLLMAGGAVAEPVSNDKTAIAVAKRLCRFQAEIDFRPSDEWSASLDGDHWHVHAKIQDTAPFKRGLYSEVDVDVPSDGSAAQKCTVKTVLRG